MDVALENAFPGSRLLDRKPYAYRTSFPLEAVRLRLPDGAELELIAKLVDRGALDERTRRAKPDFVHDPRRERAVYEEVLAPADLGTPRVYGSHGAWLFLEKVDGTELWQVGEIETWERVAHWLALMHDRLRAARGAKLLRYDAAWFRRWLERALDFHASPALQRVATRHDELVDVLLALPQSFVHGELYASNVLIAPGRVCPVDWEMAGVGPSLLDLAALVTGNWPDEIVRRLAAAYEGTENASQPLLRGLDACRLALAIQWLGWSREWSPPPQHAHDWAGDVERLADRLQL